jgi:hypothetical protein
VPGDGARVLEDGARELEDEVPIVFFSQRAQKAKEKKCTSCHLMVGCAPWVEQLTQEHCNHTLKVLSPFVYLPKLCVVKEFTEGDLGDDLRRKARGLGA